MIHMLNRLLTGALLALFAVASWAATVNDFPKAKIAIVGGTFINDALLKKPGLVKGHFAVKTKVGESPKIYYGEVAGIPFYYVHAHGEGKWLETWAALYDLGVRDAIGGATAVGINPAMKLYDYVVPHDFIDLNIDRPLSMPQIVYHDPKSIPLPRYVPAMDPLLRDILIEETRKAVRAKHDYDDIQLHEQGIVVQARGGRFETASEIVCFASGAARGDDECRLRDGVRAYDGHQLRRAGRNLQSGRGRGRMGLGNDQKVYPRLNPLSLNIVLAAIPRIAAIGDQPRVGDGLRMHPEMTSE